jgi:preprotein translocase subunit SecG
MSLALVYLRMFLKVVFVLLCVALTVIILAQEGKTQGLGSIAGAAETFWSKNKGRTIEGKLEKATKYMVILFFVLAIVISLFYNN